MQTDPTPYTVINLLLTQLLSQIQTILGQKLIGLYLYGSLVTGDFDHACSDIDLLAATSSDIDEREFEALHKMHTDFADKNKQWEDRIEVQYFSIAALKIFRSHASKMAAISPGEPFHFKEADSDWLINWYIVREKGLTLYGPSPKTLIDPISQAELLHTVQVHLKFWQERIAQIQSRKSQAYAILTMCRALYTLKNGEIVSKKQAATWAEHQFPEWAPLIQQALPWREAARDEPDNATLPQTQRFVRFAFSQCKNNPDLANPNSLL